MQRLNPERDEELYRAFKKAFTSSSSTNFMQAVRQAVNTPCSQFYISTEEAYRYIRKMKHDETQVITTWRWGGPISKEKQKALRTVYARYKELSQHRAFQGCSTLFITSFACASPAPCFFLSFRRAYEIIRQMRKYGHVRPRTNKKG